jgi:hypothetical protein
MGLLVTAWSKRKPTEPGLYWWRSDVPHAPGLCRITRGTVLGARQEELWLRIEGMETVTRLSESGNFFEWQRVEGPKP